MPVGLELSPSVVIGSSFMFAPATLLKSMNEFVKFSSD